MNIRKDNLIAAISFILIGILFCIFQSKILSWILTIVGVLLIILAIMDLVNKKNQQALIELISGAVILIFGWLLTEVALVIAGICITALGIKNFVSLNNLAGLSLGKKILAILKPICEMAVGLILIVNTFAAVNWIFIIIGVIAIVNGIGFLFDNNEVKVIKTEQL